MLADDQVKIMLLGRIPIQYILMERGSWHMKADT